MLLLSVSLSQWVEPLFKNVIPDGPLTPIERKNDQFPLWDQDNSHHWKPYLPMWDEFHETELDSKKWIDHNPTWKGRQPAWFNPRNISVSDGALNLTAKLEEAPDALKADGYKTFSTTAVESIGSVLYGAFEVRAKPMKSAVSSAFWFFDSDPADWTEIDVFEIGGKAKGFERKDHMTVHVFKTPEVPDHHAVSGEWTSDHDLADDYHVYGLEWNERQIKWYIDGVLVRVGANRYWHHALTMNFDCETMPDWFGLPDPADLPSTYSIDYVRAWQVGR